MWGNEIIQNYLRRVIMKKQIITTALALALCLAMTVTVLAVPGENWGTDTFGGIVSFYSTKAETGYSEIVSEGDYELGEYYYFRVDQSISGVSGSTVYNRVLFEGFYQCSASNVSDFEYYDKTTSTWKDASKYLKTDTNGGETTVLTKNLKTNFRAKFNKEGIYLIQASSIEVDNKFGIFSNVRYLTIGDGKFSISQNKPEIPDQKTISIDGVTTLVDEGSDYTLPSTTATYGYFNKTHSTMMKAGDKIENITEDIELFTVNSVDIATADTASIKVDGEIGIKFKSQINSIKTKEGIDITSEMLKTDTIDVATLITSYDIYNEIYKKDFTLENCLAHEKYPAGQKGSYKNVINNKTWADDNFTYFGGLTQIYESNIPREFIGRGYVKFKYASGDATTVYASDEKLPIRSIKMVAKKIQQAGYPGLTPAEIEIVDYLAAYDD